VPPDPFAGFLVLLENDFVTRAVGFFEPGGLGDGSAPGKQVPGSIVDGNMLRKWSATDIRRLP